MIKEGHDINVYKVVKGSNVSYSDKPIEQLYEQLRNEPGFWQLTKMTVRPSAIESRSIALELGGEWDCFATGGGFYSATYTEKIPGGYRIATVENEYPCAYAVFEVSDWDDFGYPEYMTKDIDTEKESLTPEDTKIYEYLLKLLAE